MIEKVDVTDEPTWDPWHGWILAVEGMERSFSARPAEWRAAAFYAVYQTCEDLQHFTTDHVWARFPKGYSTSRAMGGVLKRAQTAGWCEPIDQFQIGKREGLHARPLHVWRSLIYAD